MKKITENEYEFTPIIESDKPKFTKKEKQIINTIAKKSELIKNFDDVRVFSNKDEPLAYVDIRDNSLYINTNSPFMSFNKLLKHLEGIITHETGHLDSRLLSPSNLKVSEQYVDFCNKKKIDIKLINFVCDMEIHYQYNKAKNIKPIQRLKLKKFLTDIRNKCFEQDKTDMILSLSYQFTDEQKKVKEIIENRNIGITEKIERVSKVIKNSKNEQKKTEVTGLILPQPSNDNKKGKDGKKKSKSKQGQQNKQNPKKKSKSIASEINKKGEEKEIRNQLSSMGFSDQEVNELLKRENRDELIEKIEHLSKSFNKIIPNVDEAYTKEKSTQRTESKGYRFNGYHKLRNITEVTENIEDLVTIGKYDMNDIHIPTKIDRKQAGIIFILRDTSGSIGSGNLAKLVRDTTVGIIELAKIKGHRIGVIDFHSDVEPIKDSKGEILSKEYNTLLLDSMMFKMGYSTILSKALEYVNKIVIDKRMEEIPINIFIISDSYVDNTGKFKFVSKRVNLTGIFCQEWYSNEDDFSPTDLSHVHSTFKELIKLHNGKLYHITKDTGKLLMLLLKDYSN